MGIRVPIQVAFERGLFDKKMYDILEDPSDDTKGFFDPNTGENLTYLKLIQRCPIEDVGNSKVRLLYIVEKEQRATGDYSVRQRREGMFTSSNPDPVNNNRQHNNSGSQYGGSQYGASSLFGGYGNNSNIQTMNINESSMTNNFSNFYQQNNNSSATRSGYADPDLNSVARSISRSQAQRSLGGRSIGTRSNYGDLDEIVKSPEPEKLQMESSHLIEMAKPPTTAFTEVFQNNNNNNFQSKNLSEHRSEVVMSETVTDKDGVSTTKSMQHSSVDRNAGPLAEQKMPDFGNFGSSFGELSNFEPFGAVSNFSNDFDKALNFQNVSSNSIVKQQQMSSSSNFHSSSQQQHHQHHMTQTTSSSSHHQSSHQQSSSLFSGIGGPLGASQVSLLEQLENTMMGSTPFEALSETQLNLNSEKKPSTSDPVPKLAPSPGPAIIPIK